MNRRKDCSLASSGQYTFFSGASLLRWIAVVTVSMLPFYRALPDEVARAWTIIVAGVLVAAPLLGLARRPKAPGVWLFAGYASLGAAATSGTASELTSNLSVAAQLFVLLSVGPFAIRGIIQSSPTFLRRCCVIFVVAQTVSSVAGISQVFGTTVLGWGQFDSRSPGLSGHPNILGIMSALAALVCLAQALQRPRRGTASLLAWIFFAVNVGALIATGSLSAMSAFALGLSVALFSNGYSAFRVLLFLILPVLALWAGLSLLKVSSSLNDPLQRLAQVTGQTEQVSTLGIRSDTYMEAWRYIGEHPLLGKGLGTADAAALYSGTVVHSLPLRAWYQGGILLAVGVLVIMVALVWAALRAMIAKQSGLAAGVITAMVAFSLSSAFFEQAYYWLPVLAAWASLPRSSRTAPLLHSELRRGYAVSALSAHR